jgi:serine protease AprX
MTLPWVAGRLLPLSHLTNYRGAILRTSSYNKAVWGAALTLVLSTPALASASPARGPGGGPPGKLDAKLARGSSDEPQPVIVTMKAGGKAGVKKRLEAQGGKVLKDHSIVNAVSARVDARALAALVSDPDVAHVSVDADITPHGGGTTEPVVSALKQTLALGNWFAGSSLTVAVIDSGIAPMADFSGRIVGTYDFTNYQGGASVPAVDEYGHGSHVAGLLGSSGASSNGTYAGVAPGVKLLSLRVLTRNGSGKTSDVIAALQFAVANKSRFNIRIINLSLGHPVYESAQTDPLVQAVEAAVRSGIVVVVAAGNYGRNPVTGAVGYAGIASPGNAPSAITVGAASNANTVERSDDRVPGYSSRGPSWFDGYAKPDVVAPGHGLLSDSPEGSTLATTYPELVYQSTGGKLMRLNGSSMATGVVSGLVAVMIEAHDYAAYQRYTSSGRLKKLLPYVPPPPLSPNAIKAMLQYSATPLRDANGVRFDALTQGAGEVDGLGAITLAYMANTSAAPGTPWMAAVPASTQFGAVLESWSQQIVWGTRLVSGFGLIEVNQPAWHPAVAWGAGELDNIVWGTVDAEGDSIVWGTMALLPDVTWLGSVLEGDNIVWGTALADWGLNIVWGTSLIGILEGENIVWGTAESEGENVVWGTMLENENIVWGTLEYDNLVWGTSNKVYGLTLSGGVL